MKDLMELKGLANLIYQLQVEDLQGQMRLLQAVGFGSVEDGQQVELGGPGKLMLLIQCQAGWLSAKQSLAKRVLNWHVPNSCTSVH